MQRLTGEDSGENSRVEVAGYITLDNAQHNKYTPTRVYPNVLK